nr:PREDICTED: intercellular adhesion molecule 4 isoform X2 [Rhinolophus sinicus]
MRFLLPLSQLVLLAAAYQAGGSARRRRAVWAQGPGDNSSVFSETKAQFWVRISPTFKAVQPGSSVWLNCSSSCPLPEGPSLHTGLQRGKTLNGSNWVSFQLLDVRAWSSDVHCYVTCAGITQGATARINAYKPPHSVILEPPVLEDGLDLANVTLTYEYLARPCDLWQPVTCHARLSLDGLVVRSSSAPMTIFAWSPASKPLASTSIAALVGILLFVGAAYLRKYLLMQSRP